MKTLLLVWVVWGMGAMAFDIWSNRRVPSKDTRVRFYLGLAWPIVAPLIAILVLFDKRRGVPILN